MLTAMILLQLTISCITSRTEIFVCIVQCTCKYVTNLSKSQYKLPNKILVATHQNVPAVS